MGLSIGSSISEKNKFVIKLLNYELDSDKIYLYIYTQKTNTKQNINF